MKKTVLTLALTWDGTRWPVGKLPARAKTFLGSITALSRAKTAMAVQSEVDEIRICWVPRLKGGTEVLCDLFATGDGKRVGFRCTKTVPLGDMLGVVYRRTS